MDDQQLIPQLPRDMRPMDSHNINTNLKASARFVFNGPNIIISVPVIIVGGVVFFIWIRNYPGQAVAVSPWLIIGTFVLAAIVAIVAIAGFSLRWVGGGIMNLYAEFVDIKIKLRRNEPQPQEIESELVEDPIPAYVEYASIKDQVPRGHTLLGIGPGGRLETRPFSVLDTMLILGGSKTGKTNTITIKTEEGSQAGRRLLVCDPHLFKQDSLYNAVRGYERDFLLPVASSHDEIIAAVQAFNEEAYRRMSGGSYIEGWTIIIDEINGLCGSPGLRDSEQDAMFKLLAPLARLAGQRLRGFDMSAWFIAQSPIGLPWLMDAAMTIFVHKLLKENQQKIATNSNREIMRSMTDWPRGRVFVYGLDIIGEWTLQQPHYQNVQSVHYPPTVFTPFTHSVNAGKRLETAPLADAAPAFTFPVNDIVDAEKSLDTSEIGNDMRAVIKQLDERKMPLRDIADIVGLNGRKYRLFKAVCSEIGIGNER